MGSFIDTILVIGTALSTAAFLLSRVNNKINLATESMVYSQINIIVIASEVVKYLIFESTSDYHPTVQRCAFFVITSTIYFFIALAVRIITRTEGGQEETINSHEEKIQTLSRKIEDNRHSVSTKIHNISTKVDDLKQTQTEQQKAISEISKSLEGAIERLSQALEVFKAGNPSLFEEQKDATANEEGAKTPEDQQK